MKRKFVKPEIRNYQVSTATGQDSLHGVCRFGSFAGNPGQGSCGGGSYPTGGNCSGGDFPSANVCHSGNNVFPGAQCTVGDGY